MLEHSRGCYGLIIIEDIGFINTTGRLYSRTYRYVHIVNPRYSPTACSPHFVAICRGWRKILVPYNKEFILIDFHVC